MLNSLCVCAIFHCSIDVSWTSSVGGHRVPSEMGILSSGNFVYIYIPRHLFWCILKNIKNSDLMISMFSPIVCIDINSDQERMLSIRVHSAHSVICMLEY